MNFDFAFYLFMGSLITGLIWAFDKWYLLPKRQANDIGNTKEPLVVEYARSFFPVLAIVFLLRGFIVEPFRIPSGSMIPTLNIGDFILVSKSSYGVRLPVLNKLVIGNAKPERGDVVVFRYPPEPSVDYIKRVIGLPGDRVVYREKVLYVNDKPVSRTFVSQYTGPGEIRANEHQELLADVKHNILLKPGYLSPEGEYQVPAGHYFVMGDNRDNSRDSRVWGTVPDENLVGKAVMIWMNWSDDGIDWKRLGNMIE
ncbi:MAG: signal peptidase I [Gammaproteobacteria bacterium]|nr:signal peptidase I [Gammaproteobacteria bacterium]